MSPYALRAWEKIIFGMTLMILFFFFLTDTSCADSDFVCPEEFGYYQHPGDCSKYYVCVFGGPLLESCTGGLMYR